MNEALARLTGFVGHRLLGWHKCKTGGHTELGRVAALTWGLAAIPTLLALSGDCWSEHGDR